MRNSQFKNYFFLFSLLAFFSCQKEALVINESPIEEPKTTDATHTLFTIEGGTISEIEKTEPYIEFIKLPESIEELTKKIKHVEATPNRVMTPDEICEEKTAAAYDKALIKANSLCKAVFTEVICELEGGTVYAMLYVHPTINCLTPPKEYRRD